MKKYVMEINDESEKLVIMTTANYYKAVAVALYYDATITRTEETAISEELIAEEQADGTWNSGYLHDTLTLINIKVH